MPHDPTHQSAGDRDDERHAEATKVLYVAGTGRSGSTVLANVLGQIDGWFSAGEVRYLWERGMQQDRLCGCGTPFSECPVWRGILQTAFVEDVPDPARIVEVQRATARLRQVPAMLAGGSAAARLRDSMGDYTDVLDHLYRGIAESTRARVVVDSSKLPAYAWVLGAAPGIDLRVVHLVRDPRATAYSWLRKKALTDRAAQAHMEQIGPAKSSLLWDVWNAATDRLWPEDGRRHLVLRYEDFVASPRRAVAAIAALVGEPDAEAPFVDDHTVNLATTHTVAGNPDRLRVGPTTLRADVEWASSMETGDRMLVSALTAPLRSRYGYGTSPSGATDEAPVDRPEEDLPHEATPRARLAARLRRHWQWGRTQGFDRLVEEDNLDPVDRVRTAVAKARWRAAHGVTPGEARPVFLVGVQRSGTNMVVRGLETRPEFEVHNENDRRAFERFELRPDPVVRDVVERSRHRYVLFKPLCDSHRTADLLDGMGATQPGLAIWAFRGVDGRARSAVAKFGDVNRRVLARIAAGRGDNLWQAQRISHENRALLESCDWDTVTDLEAAALFWYVRNSLYFDQGLCERKDVHPVSYDALVSDPERVMRGICSFLGFPYDDDLVAHVEVRAPGREVLLDLDPRIRARCDDLQARLDDAAASRLRDATDA